MHIYERTSVISNRAYHVQELAWRSDDQSPILSVAPPHATWYIVHLSPLRAIGGTELDRLISRKALTLAKCRRDHRKYVQQLITADTQSKAGISWPVQEQTSDPLAQFFQPGSVCVHLQATLIEQKLSWHYNWNKSWKVILPDTSPDLSLDAEFVPMM